MRGGDVKGIAAHVTFMKQQGGAAEAAAEESALAVKHVGEGAGCQSTELQPDICSAVCLGGGWRRGGRVNTGGAASLIRSESLGFSPWPGREIGDAVFPSTGLLIVYCWGIISRSA